MAGSTNHDDDQDLGVDVQEVIPAVNICTSKRHHVQRNNDRSEKPP
jgi:hypothetical protein